MFSPIAKYGSPESNSKYSGARSLRRTYPGLDESVTSNVPKPISRVPSESVTVTA